MGCSNKEEGTISKNTKDTFNLLKLQGVLKRAMDMVLYTDVTYLPIFLGSGFALPHAKT